MRNDRGLCLLLLLLVLVALFVNPIREAMTGDDGWAYALSVRTLHETGKYHLHDWAAANMPVQIYLGALFAHLFGYSFTALRFTTLILLLVGLIAVYLLLRDFDVQDTEASFMILAVLSGPVVLFLSFTFQTDVQFFGWQILALWLYARALRRRQYFTMAMASFAASAAIGTRQFGVALVIGLLVTWLFAEKERRLKAPLYLLGLFLPVLLVFWQFHSGIAEPTFSQKVRLGEQSAYLGDLGRFLASVLWRPTAVLQYLALFLLPLTPLFIVLLREQLTSRKQEKLSRVTRDDRIGRLRRWSLIASAVYITAGILYGYFTYQRFTMPYLDWLLRDTYTPFFTLTTRKLFLLTILTGLLAIALSSLILTRYFDTRNWRMISSEEWLVAFVAAAALVLQLLYVQFYDVYLIQFLPFATLALGKMVPAWPRWCKAVTFSLCLPALLLSSLWTRGNLAEAEANWSAAELAHSKGAAPQDIRGDVTWSCYYGAFDEWVAQVGDPWANGHYLGSNRMHAEFFKFLDQRFARASYVLSTSAPSRSDINWRLHATVQYKNRWLQNRYVYLLERLKLQ
jgi:hypothetical protein